MRPEINEPEVNEPEVNEPEVNEQEGGQQKTCCPGHRHRHRQTFHAMDTERESS